jgi:hypothetical protein
MQHYSNQLQQTFINDTFKLEKDLFNENYSLEEEIKCGTFGSWGKILPLVQYRTI